MKNHKRLPKKIIHFGDLLKRNPNLEIRAYKDDEILIYEDHAVLTISVPLEEILQLLGEKNEDS